MDVNEISGWARVLEGGTIERCARPDSITLADGAIMVAGHADMNDELLNAYKEAGYFPVVEKELEPADGFRAVYTGETLVGDHVEVQYEYEAVEAAAPVSDKPEWVDEVHSRIDGFQTLFDQYRTRLDEALQKVEATAEMLSKANVEDKLGELDRLLARVKDALGEAK